MSKINYQIMNESQKVVEKHFCYEEEVYLPNYDELINNSTCKEEVEEWEDCKRRNMTFAFKMVYATKQKCGHWEIFQSPYNEYYTLDKVLKEAEEHSQNYECTRCICNF